LGIHHDNQILLGTSMSVSRRHFLKAAGLAASCFGVGATIVSHEILAVDAPTEVEAKKEPLFEPLFERTLDMRDPSDIWKEAVEAQPMAVDIGRPSEFPRPRPPHLDAFIPETWSAEGLAILEENMEIASIIHRNFRKTPTCYQDKVNVRKPQMFRGCRLGDNDPVNFTIDLVNRTVDMDLHLYTAFVIKDGAQGKTFQDLMEMYVAPSMFYMAKTLDTEVLERLIASSQSTVVDWEDFELVLKTRHALNDEKTPSRGRTFVAPSAWTDYKRARNPYLAFDMLESSEIDRGVGFHRDAAALISRPLPKLDVGCCDIYNHNDLSMRTTMEYDVRQCGTRVTMDSLFGIGVLSPEMICTAKKSAGRRYDINADPPRFIHPGEIK
jgi:hypothetical protein